MKRSEVNRAIKEMSNMLTDYKISLPPFCNWTPEEWFEKGSEYDEIRDNMLGWDVTDYGTGNFEEVGFALITLRNGNTQNDAYPKPYAEKLLYIREGQHSPMHFHWYKMEDIINKAGGNILIRVYESDHNTDELLPDKPVTVYTDGRKYCVPGGTQIKLKPGESITIPPCLYHDFNVEPGTGPVLLGEVSMCNDDINDNHFFEVLPRFSQIEEDEQPYRFLCNEYPRDYSVKYRL